MNFKSRLFGISSPAEFQALALEVFRHQLQNLGVYREYVTLLGINPGSVDTVEKIPFLPIPLFRTRDVIGQGLVPEKVFTSSGTSGAETSRHPVADLSLYTDSFTKCFRLFYGNPSDYCILALLPAYLERTGSSLVYMVDALIKQSNNPNSGFFLNEYSVLAGLLEKLNAEGQKCLLIGVTFALLDLAERHRLKLRSTVVMETGGMKGRRKEMVRGELHARLCEAFGVDAIHSEYGMTELLSQAYSAGNGIFRCPPWMKVLVREPHDPLGAKSTAGSGAINVVDLANVNSCSFIQTQDLGRLFADGRFEVLGRMGNAPLRGCNLLVYS